MVVSDGIIEQFAGTGDSAHSADAEQFGLEGLHRSLGGAREGADPIARVFSDVISHAGGPNLADDATAVLVTW